MKEAGRNRERQTMSSLSSPFVSILLLEMLFFTLADEYITPSSTCYPAVFAFGDSLTDTGNALKSSPLFFSSALRPYGETYFGRPARRYSDGRLIIDVLVQSLGLPFLNPYLNFTNPEISFSQGVNYAVAGALTLGTQYYLARRVFLQLTPLSLDVQLKWHLRVKNDVSALTPEDPRALSWPKPVDFSTGLYFVEIGGNDYGALLNNRNLSISQIENDFVPVVVQKIISGLELLYENEARNFFVLSTTAEGCAPLYHVLRKDLANDAFGCIARINELDRLHGIQLHAALKGLRSKYPDISIIYADLYRAYEDAIQNPSAYGFTNTLDTCCGGGAGYPYGFSLLRLCGVLRYSLCANPSSYATWDGIHITDSFARQIVNKFIAGEFVDPPSSLGGCASPVSS